MHRFFLTDPLFEGQSLPLTPSDVHHLRDVLRLETDARIAVVEPSGGASEVRLTSVGAAGVLAEFVRVLPCPGVPRVWLVQGLARGEKMDLVVRQATELGVERILPFASERSVVRLDVRKATERTERWRRIAAEAAKQSQQVRVPRVAELVDVAGLPVSLSACALALLAWEDAAEAPSIGVAVADARVHAADAVAVIVGPEGGFTSPEAALLVAHGARIVSLGPTVLRTETAGVVAPALVLAARGGLGGSER
jgi:16S rRNA (uracil1498-N3)-methyltransferase